MGIIFKKDRKNATDYELIEREHKQLIESSKKLIEETRILNKSLYAESERLREENLKIQAEAEKIFKEFREKMGMVTEV